MVGGNLYQQLTTPFSVWIALELLDAWKNRISERKRKPGTPCPEVGGREEGGRGSGADFVSTAPEPKEAIGHASYKRVDAIKKERKQMCSSKSSF